MVPFGTPTQPRRVGLTVIVIAVIVISATVFVQSYAWAARPAVSVGSLSSHSSASATSHSPSGLAGVRNPPVSGHPSSQASSWYLRKMSTRASMTSGGTSSGSTVPLAAMVTRS